jgi:ferric-dicitrate binding protein FerR (iron transport regulator)
MDEDFQQWVLHPETGHVFWETWLRQHPEMEPVVSNARQLVHSIRFRSYTLSAMEKEELWDAVWNTLGEEEEAKEEKPERGRWWKKSWKYAAAVLLGIVISGAWWWVRSPAPQPAIVSAHTRFGETKRLLLPDSSEVTLNADSRLLYTVSNGKREVWLDGEAFFHVRHKASGQQFIVHTYDSLSVEVLGTQFNVNSTGKEIVVVLQQGSILLNIASATTLCQHPGEMLSYSKKDGAYTKKSVDASRYTSWHTGRLVMDDFTLADAAAFMQQVFGKKLVVNDTLLLNYKVSGSMPIIYNPDTMMIQLGKVFRMQFNQRGDEVWIHKK